jgi:Uma2 family endonuclease
MSSAISQTPHSGGDWAWEIATLYPQQGRWTEEEYLSFTDSINRFIEFTDGRLEFLTRPTTEHQLIAKFLFRALDSHVETRNLGEVLFAVLRVYIREGKYREPDLAFKRNENLSEKDSRYFHGSDLVVEIVSDDAESHQRDHETKVQDYAEARIPEYWIVDPQQQKITVLALEGDSYVEHCVTMRSGTVSSRLLAEFSVDTAAVFAAGKKR